MYFLKVVIQIGKKKFQQELVLFNFSETKNWLNYLIIYILTSFKFHITKCEVLFSFNKYYLVKMLHITYTKKSKIMFFFL